MKLWCVQVQLKEYVKLKDTIYEVDPKEEDGFRFSRHLNFKVSLIFSVFVLASTFYSLSFIEY